MSILHTLFFGNNAQNYLSIVKTGTKDEVRVQKKRFAKWAKRANKPLLIMGYNFKW